MQLLRLLPRFWRVSRDIAVLEAREAWSRTDIESFQLERLNSVWAHAIAHVPYYRELRTRAALPDRFHSLEEFRAGVPALTRSVVRARSQAILSEQKRRGLWTRTSGSTGFPVSVYWPQEAIIESLRGRYRHQARWGIDPFDRQVFLWGNGDATLSGAARLRAQVRRWATDRLRNRIRLSPLLTERSQLRDHLRRLVAFRPAALYAYSSSAGLLAREAEASGVRCDSLRLAVLSAEVASPATVRAVERAFGVPAVNEYGSVECGVIATEGPDRVLQVREDNLLVETGRRDDGRWDTLVTTLGNCSFPPLRYAIGDATDAPLAVPARGFATLANIAGRASDSLRARSGRVVHWSTLEFVFEHDSGVRRYAAHQRSDGSVAVEIEAANPALPPDAARLRRQLHEMVEGYPVEVVVVPALRTRPGGKHRCVVSELAPRPEELACEPSGARTGAQRERGGRGGEMTSPVAHRLGLSPADAGKRAAGLIASGLHRAFGARDAGRPGIFVYHRVADPVRGVPTPTINVPPARFRAQLAGLLARGFVARSLTDLLGRHEAGEPVPPRTFVVTFDDGYENVYTRAFPVLRELNVPATVFVNTAFLDQDQPFPFDAWGRECAGAAPAEAYRPLTVAQCREMAAGGLIEIAAHTHTHDDFRGRPDALRADLHTCVAAIRAQFGSDRVTFAFPYGRKALGYVNAELLQAARDAGAAGALTTEAELVDPRSDPFGWGRFNAYHWDTAATLAAKLAGWYGWAPRLHERMAGAIRRRGVS